MVETLEVMDVGTWYLINKWCRFDPDEGVDQFLIFVQI